MAPGGEALRRRCRQAASEGGLRHRQLSSASLPENAQVSGAAARRTVRCQQSTSLQLCRQVERGLRKPSADVLSQVAKALRVSAEVLYVRAGMLGAQRERSQVRDAIITDTAITERQKQILLDIYASFAQQNESIQEESVRPSPTATIDYGPNQVW